MERRRCFGGNLGGLPSFSAEVSWFHLWGRSCNSTRGIVMGLHLEKGKRATAVARSGNDSSWYGWYGRYQLLSDSWEASDCWDLRSRFGFGLRARSSSETIHLFALDLRLWYKIRWWILWLIWIGEESITTNTKRECISISVDWNPILLPQISSKFLF